MYWRTLPSQYRICWTGLLENQTLESTQEHNHNCPYNKASTYSVKTMSLNRGTDNTAHREEAPSSPEVDNLRPMVYKHDPNMEKNSLQ